jgi:hypothetical protein
MDDDEFHSSIRSVADRGAQPRQLIAVSAEIDACSRRRDRR